MSNPTSFMNVYVDKISTLTKTMEDLRSMNDMLTQDPTLIDRYFSAAGARDDIAAADVNAAQASLVQIIFTYDSGSPPQKAALFKLLP